MLEVSGNGYTRSGDDFEWPTITFEAPIKAHFGIIYRDIPIKGLRTFPNKKKRLNKKETKKRESNIVAIATFD